MNKNNRIGFIGLGIMGAPMAGHLLEAGFPLVVHTRTRSKADALLARGATWAASPAEAAREARSLVEDAQRQAAIEAKLEEFFDWAERRWAEAAHQLARLDVDEAWEQLHQGLRQFGGSKDLALSDGMKNAIAALSKFIADHPTEPLAEKSAQIILSIANTYQQHGAFDAATQIYSDLATFAAKQPTLSQATPVSARRRGSSRSPGSRSAPPCHASRRSSASRARTCRRGRRRWRAGTRAGRSRRP